MTDDKKVLCIIPTKDRPECINVIIQDLIHQKPTIPDIFIADMSSNPNLLKDNWLLHCATQHYKNVLGGKIILQRVEGRNQLFGHQAGLEYALDNDYDLCVSTDDDITFAEDFFALGKPLMNDESVGCVCGYTLLPFQPIAEQSCWMDYALNSPEYQGRLKEMMWYHCSVIDPRNIQKYPEQIYGPFFYRAKEMKSVGGFPLYLSPLGFRGESMAQTALYFSGLKHLLDPRMRCWHWSCSFGGLRLVQGDTRKLGLAHDSLIWEKFLERHTPSTARPEGV